MCTTQLLSCSPPLFSSLTQLQPQVDQEKIQLPEQLHIGCRGFWAPETSGQGRHSLPSMHAVTRAFPNCSRNIFLLFFFPDIQVELISCHITKALYEDMSMMLWKMTRGQRAVILHPSAAEPCRACPRLLYCIYS